MAGYKLKQVAPGLYVVNEPLRKKDFFEVSPIFTAEGRRKRDVQRDHDDTWNAAIHGRTDGRKCIAIVDVPDGVPESNTTGATGAAEDCCADGGSE